MKQINILKKAAGAISILLILLSLTACGNAISENNGGSLSGVEGASKTTTEGITFKGQIKLPGTVSARSATSSFDGNYTWHIIAQNSDLTEAASSPTQEILEQAYRSTVSTTDEFTLTLPVAGNWTLVIYGFAGTYTESTLPVYTSAIFVYADNNFTISEEDADKQFTFYPTLNASALAFGSEDGSLSGSLSLPITCNAETVHQVSAKLKNYLEPDAEPVVISPKIFSTDTINLTASNIPAGIYTARIYFENTQGNNLYSCTEAITIYPGLTTDTWFGTAPYLTNGNFVLTASLVAAYGAETVPNTDFVLYNFYQAGPEFNSEKKYYYYFVSEDELDNPIPSPAVTSLAVGDSSSIKDARCFDSEGNLYLLQLTSDYENDIALESTKTEWTAPNMKQKLGINFASESNIAITSDFKTNKFYIFLIHHDGDTTISVNCYPDILSSNGSTTTKLSKSLDFGGGSISSYYFAVNNDNLYMLSTSQGVSNPYTLRFYDLSLLSGDASSINYSKSISIDLLSILGVDEIKGEISDMLYQDGCLYMLYKEVSDYNADPDVYSRGGVIQYNLLTGSTLFKGFTTNYIARDSGYSLQAMTKDTYGNQYFLYMDASGNEPFVPEVNKAEQYPDIYVPGENDSSFYGPTKFIAIKPKQLVISDEGFAYYTNNGLLYRKNVNRVAIVNLEDFAMEFKNINPSLSMEKNYTGNLLNSGSVGLDAADVYYKKDGDNYTAFSSDCCYLCVITEE